MIGYDWKYLYVNASVVAQGKYLSKNDLLGFTMMDRYPGIENTPMFACLQRVMNERTSEDLENEFTFPDGSTGWFELKVRPVPEGIIIFSTDVTERKNEEKRRREQIDKLEHMLHLTSHNIRSPVTRILGLSEVLKLGVTNDEMKEMFGQMVMRRRT